MGISFLDVESFCKQLKPVTSSSYVTRNNEFHQDGLFSEIIFGNLGSLERKKNFSYINLNCKVVHPSAYKLLIQLDRKIEKLISTEDTFSLDKDSRLQIDEKGVTGISAFISMFPKIKFRGETKEREKIINVLEREYKRNNLFISKIPVIPPDQRPIFQDEETKEWTVDTLNDFYVTIIRRAQSIKSAGKTGVLYDLLNYGVQKAVIEHDEFIRTKIGKKFGLIRSQLLGKRVDFSGRAVITDGPDLKATEIGIPFRMAVNLFFPFLVHILLNSGRINKKYLEENIREFTGTELSIDSIQKVIKSIKNGDKVPQPLYDIFFDACSMAMEGRVVLAKRDPVLHPESIRGFIPVLIHGNTIQISTLVVGGFNADFDGDQMAVFHPLTDEAQLEARQRLLRAESGESSKSITFSLSKEMCVGLYLLTKNVPLKQSPKNVTIEDLNKATNPYIPVNFRNKVTTIGKAIVNNCLPEDFRFVDDQLNKKLANNLLNELLDKYGTEKTLESASKLKDVGFKFATIMAPSIPLEEMDIPPEIYKLKAQLDKVSTEEAIVLLDKMRKIMIEHLKGKGLYDLVDSGSTKGWDQPFQMLVAKGIIADAEGNILEPIKGSFSDGLTPVEYFNASSGARKGIIDRVLNTADTGYTSRQLAYLLNSVECDLYLKDCGTKEYLHLKLTDDLIGRLSGRFIFLNDKIVEFNSSKFKKNDMIYLRTPIFCKSLKICHTCYGKLIERHKSPYVGVLAAQNIGERGTQLIMRSFHTGGAVKISQRNIINDIMENDPYINKKDIDKLMTQVENSLECKSKFDMILDMNEYNRGENFLFDDNGTIWVRSLLSEINTDENIFNMILDYSVEIQVPKEIVEIENKKIILKFLPGDKILEVPLEKSEIKEQVLYVQRLLGGRELFKDIEHLYSKLYNVYGPISDMDSVHMEVLLSQCLRDSQNPMFPARVGKNPRKPQLSNIKTNIFASGFLQGLCFENVGKAIKTGLVSDYELSPSVLEKVMTGELVEVKKEEF